MQPPQPKVTADGDTVQSKYSYVALELVSPAYYFGDAAKTAIRNVCNLLANTYCLNNNRTTGFHVHVGNGVDGFPFHTIRNLVLFLWVFEPQLNMLHADHRQDSSMSYCRSNRGAAPFVYEHLEEHGRYPTVYEGVMFILSCEDTDQLINKTCGSRNRGYNFMNFIQLYDIYKPRLTLEFRQHEGTFDSEAVVIWVEVCQGIVKYVQHISPEEVDRLVRFSKLESWTESGAFVTDREMQQKLGPVLAKGKFTVLDLLRVLGLEKQAEYYSVMVKEKLGWSSDGSDITRGSWGSDFYAAEDFFDQFLHIEENAPEEEQEAKSSPPAWESGVAGDVDEDSL